MKDLAAIAKANAKPAPQPAVADGVFRTREARDAQADRIAARRRWRFERDCYLETVAIGAGHDA